MMELLVQKLLAVLLIVSLSLIFGFLPLLLAKWYDFSSIDTLDADIMKKERKKLKNVALSFLLNLGGGVLIANCFCHWLPEVREGLEHKSIDSFLPLAEVIMCTGFFFICGLEEMLHYFLHPYQSVESNTQSDVQVNEEEEDKKVERTETQIKAAIRTVFVVFALSFHSMIEGLALSLESNPAGVWLNTGATALHKFVISFSVGVELVSNKLCLSTYSISIMVFSLAPAIGSFTGIFLTELLDTSIESKINLPLQILQGVATGTIVYVVFFEIIPKAKSVGGTGRQHIIAMVLGFVIFLPSLYFHQEHDEVGSNKCVNSSLVNLN